MSDAVVKALQKKASLSAYQPTFREKASDVLRALLYSDDREGQRQAERLLGVLETTTPIGVATGIDDMREAAGQGDYATAGMMGAMAMVPGPSPKIKAYHGSPHSFDRFSMDKIGTGEGAQAYGHGLYFAESEGVAKSYRDQLAKSKVSIDGKIVDTPTVQKAAMYSPSPDDYIKALEKNRVRVQEDLAKYASDPEGDGLMGDIYRSELKHIDDKLAELRQYSGKWFDIKSDGSMYEVEINASPDDFLDWDKPLSEQPNVTSKLGNWPLRVSEWERSKIGPDPRTLTGGTFLARTTKDAAKTTSNLREAGIPGIKYLDAGSRTKGDGSRNYVVFDENLINIVRKYGIAGASAMLGYNLMDSIDPAQAKQLEQLEQVRKLDSIMGGAK